MEKQLAALEALKGRRCDEVEMDEKGWEQLTQRIIERAFGAESTNVNKFHHARWEGVHNIGGVSPHQQQQNYELRMQHFDVLLRALIEELRIIMPEEEIKGAYDSGDEYGFYRDLKDLIQKAQRDILIVDAYVDQKIFDLYAGIIPSDVTLRILSQRIYPTFDAPAKLYARSRPLSVRETPDIHDRVIFIDNRAWVTGQSIKDAAKGKPTYLIELGEPALSATRDAHEAIWLKATVRI